MTEFHLLEGGFLTEGKSHDIAASLARRTGGDPLSHEAHLTFTRAYTTLTGAVRRHSTSSLSLGRHNVLRFLYTAPERRLLMSEIGEKLEVSATVVTRLIESLVAEELVRREEHSSDKRKTWAALTSKGAALFEAELPSMLELVEDLWQSLRDDEKRVLIHLLTKLRISLLSLETPLQTEFGAGSLSVD